MKKKEDWFRLDYAFYDDPCIQRLIETQGSKAMTVYMVIISLIYEGDGYIPAQPSTMQRISEITREDIDTVKKIINSCFNISVGGENRCLLRHDPVSKRLTSDRVDRELSYRKDLKESYAKRGRKGAEKRYGVDSLAISSVTVKQIVKPQAQLGEPLNNTKNDGSLARSFVIAHDTHDNVLGSMPNTEKQVPLVAPFLVVREKDELKRKVIYWAQFRDEFPFDWRKVNASRVKTKEEKAFMELTELEQVHALQGISIFFEQFAPCVPFDYIRCKFWTHIKHDQL